MRSSEKVHLNFEKGEAGGGISRPVKQEAFQKCFFDCLLYMNLIDFFWNMKLDHVFIFLVLPYNIKRSDWN